LVSLRHSYTSVPRVRVCLFYLLAILTPTPTSIYHTYRCLSGSPDSLCAPLVCSDSSTFSTPSRSIIRFSQISQQLNTPLRKVTIRHMAAEIHMPLRYSGPSDVGKTLVPARCQSSKKKLGSKVKKETRLTKQRPTLPHRSQHRITPRAPRLGRMDIRNPSQQQRHRSENLHRKENAEVPRSRRRRRRVDDESYPC
jgi:hypothetical protein